MAEEHVAETPEEVEAPAQEAVETNTPFEGEFDPERARRTIDNLRNREKELEQQLKSDEWFEEQLRARGYETVDDDDEPDEPFDPQDYEDPYDQRISQVEEMLAAQQQEQVLNDLSDHIDELASQADVKLSEKAKEWIQLSSIHGGNGRPTPQATEEAFAAMRDFLEDHGKAAVDKYLKSKRADPAPSPGTAGQPSGDFDPKSDKSRMGRMAALIAAKQQQA